VILAGLVVAVSVVVSFGVGAVLAIGQRDAAVEELDRRAALVADAVVSETGRYVDTLRTVAAASGAFEPMTAARFAQVARSLQEMRLAGATSLVYLVPAAEDQIPAVQALWRTRGVPDLVLNAQGDRREHIFSVFSAPLDGKSEPRVGIDASQSAAPAQALNEARRSGRITVSDAYHLIIDRHLPAGQRQLSVSLAAPVYGQPDAAGERAFRGWVLMGLRGQEFLGATLGPISQDLVDVTVHARDADGRRVRMATLHAKSAGRRDLSRTVEVNVADRYWQLEVEAHGLSLPGGSTGLPTVVTLAGTVLGLLLAGLVYVLATGRARAQARVRAATADLTVSEVRARRQAGLLTAVLDSISDGVSVVDEFGEYLLHNPAARAMLGMEDVGGPENWQRHYGLYTPDGAAPFPTGDLPTVRALAGESSEQVPMMIRNASHPDGRIVSVSARPLCDDAGQRGAVAVFHDVTARTRAEHDLAATTARLREELVHRHAAEAQLQRAHDDLAAQKGQLSEILDAIDIAVVTCDTDGVIVQANPVARARLTAAGPSGAGPMTVADRAAALRLAYRDGTPLAPADVPLQRSLLGEEVAAMEIVAHLPDRPAQVLMTHSRPLHDTAGNIVGAVASSYDITALREREAELAAFAGIVAHDLKSPLTTIAGYTEIVLDDLVLDPTTADQADMLGRVLTTTRRMRRLVDDLLTYAAARDGTLAAADLGLRELVDEIVTERLAGLAVDPEAPAPQVYVGPLPRVHADPAMLRQLMDNLIDNALKYTPPGLPARVDVTALPEAAEHDGFVRIEVADRGIGIPEGQHHAIFGDFHRAHHEHGYAGTGLGLAICQRVIVRHGGTIGVIDNPGGGARFWFTLPAASTSLLQERRQPLARRAGSA
jgi:signal transduction histidine kinase